MGIGEGGKFEGHEWLLLVGFLGVDTPAGWYGGRLDASSLPRLGARATSVA